MAALSAGQGQAALAGSSAPRSLQSTGKRKPRTRGMGAGCPEHTVRASGQSTSPLRPLVSGVGLGELCSSLLTFLLQVSPSSP